MRRMIWRRLFGGPRKRREGEGRLNGFKAGEV